MNYERKTIWLAIITAVFTFGTPTHADMRDTLKKLASGTGNNEQLDAAAAITGNRDEVIQSLLQIAETSNGTNRIERLARQLAIDCLGDYRAEKAVGFLVSEIRLKEVFPRKRGMADPDPKAGMPCLRSLIQIGQPSIRGIFQRLSKPATGKELALFGFVIHEINGEKVGLFRLENALREADARLNTPPLETAVTEEGLTERDNLRRLVEIYRTEGWSKREYLMDEPSPGSEPRK